MKGIFTICLIIGFFIAYGQGDQMDTTNTKYLSEVTISVNRWEQDIMQVPVKVTAVDRALIGFQNAQTAADLLNFSDNVYVQKSQLGGGSPALRGFATNRVMLVVDGVRMNNAIFRAGNIQNVISLDAHAIQEAEIVFGPGAVMYGSDAIGGVMDFHTLKPVFTEKRIDVKANAVARYSTANREKTLHADFNIASTRWSLLTSATRSVYDNLRMGSDGPAEYTRPDYVARINGTDVVQVNDDPDLQVNSGYDQWNVMQKICLRPGEKWDFNYAFHYSETSSYPRYDRLILRENNSLSNAEWYYGPQKWMMHSLRLGYKTSWIFGDRHKITFAYQDYKESRHNRSFGSARRTDRAEGVKAFSVNLDVDKQLSPSTALFYGAEFVTNSVSSAGSRQNIDDLTVEPVSTRYPDGAQWRSSAIYANLKVNATEKLILNAGARYTGVYTEARFDRTFFNFPFTGAKLKNGALNGTLGMVFNPAAKWKIYGNLSTGFRAPNVDDVGKVFDSEPGSVVVPNPDLKPEYAYNAEAGFAGWANENLMLDLAAYYTILDNAIVRGKSTFDGEDSIEYDGELSEVQALQNISKVWITGIQAGVNWKFADGFTFRSTINYQKGREKDALTNRDVSPTHVAPVFGATHVIFAKKGLKADLYSVYNGAINYEDLAPSERADGHLYAKDSEGNPYAPSWTTLNAKFTYRFSPRIGVDAGVENILDKRYRPYSSGISSPGRNFIFALRASI